MSVYYNPNIATNGLILYVDAANTKSYPGSGTTWYDLSGNGNNGTHSGSPTYSTNNFGYMQYVNGPNTIFNQNAQINDLSGNYTYEIAFQPAAQPSYLYGRVWGKINWLETGLMLVGTWNAGSFSFGFSWGSGGTGYGSTGVSDTTYGKWYHCVFTRIGANYSVYYFYPNTIVEDTQPWTYGNLTNASYNLRIGTNATGNEASRVNVAFFRQYNRGLSRDEVYASYYNTRNRFGI